MNESSNGSQSFIQPASSEPVPNPKEKAKNKELQMKLFKQHMEIVKLKEDLEFAETNKKELEDELKQRNEENY